MFQDASFQILVAIAEMFLEHRGRVWKRSHRLLLAHFAQELFERQSTQNRSQVSDSHPALRHSAEVMYELMTTCGGLDADRAKLVLDQQPTKENLRKQIMEWLPEVSQPGDTVFIYFSGHAGPMQEGDSLEPDGRDEGLGPYDLTVGSDDMSPEQRRELYRRSKIADDTLAQWMQALTGRQIVLILDTCYSGGMVEGKQSPTRLE